MEIYLSATVAKCFLDDRIIKPDEVAVLRVMASHKTAVIKRETDLLSDEELRRHSDLAAAAILEELTIWHGHGCFERELRSKVWNLMDSRFVAKWKYVTDPHGEKKRIIRMRMTIRGFQDWFAHLEENSSPTAARLSQRLVASETACHTDWIIITIDVEEEEIATKNENN